MDASTPEQEARIVKSFEVCRSEHTEACQAIHRWHLREADLFDLNFGLDDYEVIRQEDMRAINDRNLWFAQTSVWIFGISWSLMALLSIYLHLKKS